MILRCFVLAAMLAAVPVAEAAERVSVAVTDAVPNHPGLTYQTLLKRVMPGLSVDAEGVWHGGEIPGLRLLGGEAAGGVSPDFKTLETLTVKAGGKPVLVLLTQGDDGFSAVVAAFDLSAHAPRALDIAAAGMDRFTNLGTVLELAGDTDAFTLTGWHLNAGENYELTDLVFMKDGRFAPILSQLAYSVLVCGWQTTETTGLATEADAGAPYRAIIVSVTEETVLSGEPCDAGTMLPKAGTRTLEDTYRWDAAKGAFVTATRNLDALMGPD